MTTKAHVPEFTLRATLLGIVLGLLFGVGNAYLGLRIGMTVSASIPAAVLSMTILRFFFRRVSILENNLVQTIASVGEGLAAGIIFTVPALFLLGEPIPLFRLCLLATLGGILGVLFMIPMRRYIIVKEHGVLPFPEGTACAEILKSREGSRTQAIRTLIGIVVGSLYKMCTGLIHLWQETVAWTLPFLNNTRFSIDVTPALLGVGCIIGMRISAVILAGGALSWWVVIPLLKGAQTALSAEQIWSEQIRYIGAGTIAMGGIFSLLKIGPLIWKTVHVGFSELFKDALPAHRIPRTDRDISLKWLLLGSVAIILTLWLFPGLPLNFVTIVLLTFLGFFFVAVTSLTVGIVGSSSNPVSGMAITTLLLTCLIFIALGWTERFYVVSALTMAIVANVAICLAGTTAQDLKTGFLVGATPRHQQIAEIIGILLPTLAIGLTVITLGNTYGFGSEELPAPQGTMMALIAQGVLERTVPVALVAVGLVLGALLALLRVPILPFAVGFYLPLSLSTATALGGFVAWCLEHVRPRKDDRENSVMIASGLVAGDACTGVLLALLGVSGLISLEKSSLLSNNWGVSSFLLLALWIFWLSRKKTR